MELMRKTVLLTSAMLLAGSVWGYDPPKGLNWDNLYSDARRTLEAESGVTVNEYTSVKKRGGPRSKSGLPKGYEEYVELGIPAGFKRVEVKGLKVAGKETQRVYMVFGLDTSLQAFQYVLKWDNDERQKGARKCWVAHSDLRAALVEKYGEPSSDEAIPNVRGLDIPSGLKYTTTWNDTDSSMVRLIVTRQTHNAIIGTIDAYLLFVLYTSSSYPEAAAFEKVEDEL
jgi:hypothetical protein